jgi:hypothetical protein
VEGIEMKLINRLQLREWVCKTHEFLCKNRVTVSTAPIVHGLAISDGQLECCIHTVSGLHVQYIRSICLMESALEFLDENDTLYVICWVEKIRKASEMIEPIAIDCLVNSTDRKTFINFKL